ncbi:MAG: hypothetical protein AAGF12_37065, partial [Myxococcota bacterium]
MAWLLLLAIPRTAEAQDPCADASGCHVEPLVWFHSEEAGSPLSIDTGWVPSGSPIQLRIGLFVGAGTEVEMNTDLVHRWQPAIEGQLRGDDDAGRLSINYGIEFRVELRFDVTIAGIRYTWTGSIPVPGFPEDLRAIAEGLFTPLLLPPLAPMSDLERPVTVRDTTDNVRVLRYDALGGFISVPGVSGGISLNMQADMEASYQTDRVIFEGKAPLLTELEKVLLPSRSLEGYGRSLRTEVHPEGTLTQRGVIYIRPSLYLDFVGTRRDYPLLEIPLEFTDEVRNVVFPTQTIDVPLPDVVFSTDRVDFGQVDLGETGRAIVGVENQGLAPLEVRVEAPPNVRVGNATFSLPPATQRNVDISYSPERPGDLTAALRLLTNDPDSAERFVD